MLVMLPSSTNRLLEKWTGQYAVEEVLSSTTYKVAIPHARKNNRTFHVNMLSRWESPSAICLLSVGVINNAEPDFPSWRVENTADIKPHMDPTLSQMRREDIQKALEEYKAARGTAAGRTDCATMRIETGPAPPSSSPLYRLVHTRKPIVQEEIKEMLHDDIIQPSHSPWATPMVLVPKKNGTLRICIDYRKLNAVTRPDPFPIPRIGDLLDGMSSAKFIRTLDLARGYWQVPMDPASREKTAFSMDFGKYEFRVMPFGLVGASATFQRLMNELFGDLHGKVAAYMDDLAIYSTTWEDHIANLRETLKRLAEAGLQIKLEKCQFEMTSCDYLGHRIGHRGLQPNEAKVSAIQAFKVPKRKKDLRAFLGLTGYYRRFVPRYADIAAPLTNLTGKLFPEKLKWEEQHQAAYSSLKEYLKDDTVVMGPDYSTPFLLQTDASEVDIGAVLSQLDEQKQDRPVAYFSRKLKRAERNYATVERECLAIVGGIKHFEVYLTGVPITVVTDHGSRMLEVPS